MSALILLVGLLLDAAFGEPRWLWSRLPHPAVLMGNAVALLERHLNKGRARIARGICALALLIVAAAWIGFALSMLGPIAEALCVAILLAQRSLVDHVSAVADGLRLSLGEGRQAVSRIVGRDMRAADPPAIARAAIESAAENLSDGVIAPAFWFLLAGLPGLLVYKVVNTADSMIGYLSPRYAAFGKAAARVDDVLNWAPARLTCLLIIFVEGFWHARVEIAANARTHRSPNAGWPEAAMAQALGIALAGPRRYEGVLQDLAWINPQGRKEIGPIEIDGALRILWKTWSAALLALALLALI